ncbi:unnamed protein product [Nezara viridula]|uniref:Uncharacterized protein n=1 Tax=Nezara viridula TaxID=85310 RepID=A0A9P0H8G7_NEZVI|nr:unnamed protein product [Nezara viridula]
MMSRNSSVAILADCTDLDNNPVTLMGLNGSSSMVSIENETILGDDTNISPNHVIGNISFQERVQSTNLAALFPRGNLDIKMKKRRSSESSPSTSHSENISNLQSNINDTKPDENVSNSFEECSENKKMENEEESTKPFNMHMYLKKKSVNISIDFNSVSDSIIGKSIEENATESADNVSNELVVQNHNDIANVCSENKEIEKKERSTEPFNEHLDLKEKSVNISIDSNSLSDPITETILEKNSTESAENVSTESVVVQNNNNGDENKTISNSSEIENGAIIDNEEYNNLTNIQTSNSLKAINTTAVEQDCSVGNSRSKKVKSISSCDNINEGSKESHPISFEINSSSKHISHVISDHNLRDRGINNKSLNFSKRSRSGDKDLADNLKNFAKKNKTSVDGNEDFTENISIISDTKPVTASRFKYHSTPISRRLSNKNRSKIKYNSNIKTEDGNIQQDSKMIQVSKSIFGPSTEITNATVVNKSIQFSKNSSPYNEKTENNIKRKSEIKNVEIMESIGESRSYHSKLVSTLEDNSSHYATRKSVKRVAFKSISSYENSFGYLNSSDDYASRNRKSVGFRNGISLIEDTVGENSEGDIHGANNSDLTIGGAMPGTVNDLKSDMSRNFIAEVPEIILTENEIECNETSKECSLLNKLFEMAGNKKSVRNVTTRQTKLSRGRSKLESRSNSMHREKFTPFEFQRKAVPLEGYFGSCKRGIKRKLTDPILTETEKMNVFS